MTFADSQLRYAAFDRSKLQNVSISNSNLNDTSFAECQLKNLDLNETEFLQSNFFHTPLKRIDFTRCRLEGICVSGGLQELGGVIVTPFQAAELAKLLGVIVKD